MIRPVRNHFFLWLLVTVPFGVSAQKTDSSLAAFSTWQHVTIQRSAAVSLSSASRLTVFNELFADNRHHWPTGDAGGFSFEMNRDGYLIRRTGKRDGKSGRAFIMLPDTLDLNLASAFVIEVDMVVSPGVSPEGGLLVGVADRANYNLVILTSQNRFMAKRVVDGTAASTYSSGRYSPGPADAGSAAGTRNTLRVEKHDGQLFFAINGQYIPGDSVAFRKFSGNGIGFITATDSIRFQNLRITVGMP